MSYQNKWGKFPIEDGEVWSYVNSHISVADVRKGIPSYMLAADMIYCDPPWSLSNQNMFNSKAGYEYSNCFSEFYEPFFKSIKLISPKVCYLEIGKQYLDLFQSRLSELFNCVQMWEITYYNKNSCHLLRAGDVAVSFNFAEKDDADTPRLAISTEKPNIVADMCTGRGLTGIAALEQGCAFVGTELNKAKLALFIHRAKQRGYGFQKSI